MEKNDLKNYLVIAALTDGACALRNVLAGGRSL